MKTGTVIAPLQVIVCSYFIEYTLCHTLYQLKYCLRNPNQRVSGGIFFSFFLIVFISWFTNSAKPFFRPLPFQLSSGRGNGNEIATNAISCFVSSPCHTRQGKIWHRCHINHLIFSIESFLKQIICVYVIGEL